LTSENDPSQSDSRRVATVDVGSNSIRLLVAEVKPDGSYRVLDDEKVVARLGRGMARSRRLAGRPMRDAVRALGRMKAIADGYNVQALRAVATCAVREADNRDQFLQMVRDETGLELEIISGEDEAHLAYLSVRSAFDIHSREVAIIDIGGGSTEIVLVSGGLVQQISSLPLGAVRLTEAAGDDKTPPEERLRRMRKLLRRQLKRNVPKPETPPQLLIGTGGTFTTLAAIDLRRQEAASGGEPAPLNVRGHEVGRADVRRLTETLNAMSLRQRLAVAGLSADRAEIIVAGLVIVETVMRRLTVKTLQVHDRGIRDGLLLSLTRRLFPQAGPADIPGEGPPDPLQAVRRFAEKCNYERPHCERVADLALNIYDELARQMDEPPTALREGRYRLLLHAAAILHDIGYLVNYARHHKHSYHLIMHSDLAGFTHRELELVANIARYHRRARPKARHPNLQRLRAGDRDIVRQLAAILRIADGLERAHSGNVRGVQVRMQQATALFIIQADEAPDVELWGASRKSRLFARVFSLEPRFLWEGDVQRLRAELDAAASAPPPSQAADDEPGTPPP